MLNGLVDPIDGRLRVIHSITEFTGSRDCIFHMQLGINRERIGPQDGTVVDAGARILICICGMNTSYLFLRADPGWAGRAG